MTTKDEARRSAEAFLDTEIRARFSHEVIILDDHVTERDDAWVFPYNGRGYVERDDFTEVMAGNEPVVVDKRTGVARFAR